MVSAELQDYPLPGAVLGLFFGLLVVLVDRLLKGFSLRAFSSATFGLLLGFFFAKLLIASDVLRYQSDQSTKWAVRLIILRLRLSRHDAGDAQQSRRIFS